MGSPSVQLRPIAEDDLELLQRFAVEPELLGPEWPGFTDVGEVRRQFETNGYLGEDRGRLMVVADGEPAGTVSWIARRHARVGQCWSIGIALVPEWRGRGVGWRAQG